MPDKKKPYVPIPSVGHELGVMFGFIGFFIISFVLYSLAFRRSSRKHRDANLQGIQNEKSGLGLQHGESELKTDVHGGDKVQSENSQPA